MSVSFLAAGGATAIAAVITGILMSAIQILNQLLTLYDKNLEVLPLLAVLVGLTLALRSESLSFSHGPSRLLAPS